MAKPRIDVRKEVQAAAWVEVAPGLSFGVVKLPTPWARWWQLKLLGWTYRTTREPVK